MKTKNLIAYLIVALLSAPFALSAQDSTKTFTLSGSIDAYAHSSFGINNTLGTSAPTTSFANLKGFSLGMANLIASYQGEKSGFVADLVFGPRGLDAVFGQTYSLSANPAYGQRIINQLFAYYKAGAFTFNLGQFNTFLGYEVISPTLNFHYSTSYLFSNGPFNHTGFRVDFTGESGIVAKLAIMNPTDIVEFNPVNTYTLGGQLGYVGDAGGIWLNALYGDQDGKLDKDIDGNADFSNGKLFQVDLTTGWNIGESFYLGFNTSYQTIAEGEVINNGKVEKAGNETSSFFGAAIYPKFTISDNFALGLRGEYFSSKKSHPLASPITVDGNGKGDVIALTLSGNCKVGGLTIIPEVRVDKTSELSYFERDGKPTDLMPSLTLAAVYKF